MSTTYTSDETWTRPDLKSSCTFAPGTDLIQSPHKHFTSAPWWTSKIQTTGAASLIGNTPMVKLLKIPKTEGVQCEIVAKCEFLNVGGSVKDRIALRMVEEAERAGTIKPSDTLIEPTSGNTGIGLALVSAIKGYRCVIVMPEKMSMEKQYVLQALGAEVVRTPTAAHYTAEDSHLRTAETLKGRLGPSAHILNQYVNPYNSVAHFDQTAEEILRDCTEADGHINLDVVVVGAGTGGTVSGLARKFQIKHPKCTIIAVDPEGSLLSHGHKEKLKPYDVEGIGYDFYPTVLDEKRIHGWVQTKDKESFLMARRIIREEGLLVGGSSGAALVAAIKVARDMRLTAQQRMVVIFPDSVRNYLTKFLSDEWMYSRGHLNFPTTRVIQERCVGTFSKFIRTLAPPVIMRSDTTIASGVQMLRTSNSRHAIVVDARDEDRVVGIFDSTVLKALLKGSATPDDPVDSVMTKDFPKVTNEPNMQAIGRHLMVNDHTMIVWHNMPWIVTQENYLNWLVE